MAMLELFPLNVGTLVCLLDRDHGQPQFKIFKGGVQHGVVRH
jgi:hypothetical protein